MRALVLFAMLLAVFASCQRDEKVVYIEFNHSEGIKTKSDVLLNGVSVGTVLDVTISTDYKVIATVRLSDSLDFPKDSGFEIQSHDLFTKAIYLTLGKSKAFLKNGDAIQGITSVDVIEQNSCEDSPPSIFKDLKEILKNTNP